LAQVVECLPSKPWVQTQYCQRKQIKIQTVLCRVRRQRLRGSKFETSLDKMLVRSHLNEKAGCGGVCLSYLLCGKLR
jgi:hypothetical protein